MSDKELERLAINVVRGLALDAPDQASPGHPGGAMALAPLAYVLWTRVLRHDPSAPEWPDRDRVVLPRESSTLLHSMLHLIGYGVTLDDVRGSHPAGADATAGPLGQGFADAVGMGLAERWLRARFGADACDHHTFVLCREADLQDGVSHEAASLAGHLGLGRLVCVYDDNDVTVGGPTGVSQGDDVPKRFEAYGWHVDPLGDVADDTDALEAALRRAMAVQDRPSLVALRTHPGRPRPTDAAAPYVHGDPRGEEEVRAAKEVLGLPPDRTFWVPDEVLEHYRECIPRGQARRREWQARMDARTGDRAELEACLSGRGLEGWHQKLPSFQVGDQVATTVASNDCVNAVADVVPGLFAGGAGLLDGTGTELAGHGVQSAAAPDGRLVRFGRREQGMGGIMNGAALHGGVLPVGGTSFGPGDHVRAAARLATARGAKVVWCWSHDAVEPGEDGPANRPVEQLAAVRAMPGVRVLRPADANEVAHAWRVAVDSDGPTALFLSGREVPVLEGTADRAPDVARGAYVLHRGGNDPDIVLVGTGSEVHVCLGAADRLAQGGVQARVVSMPSWDLFENQDDAYQESVLPSDKPTLAVEAAASFGWDRWADDSVSIDGFGPSATGRSGLEGLGFTPENVAERARALLAELAEEQ